MSKIIFLFFFSGHSFLCFPYPIFKIMLFLRASDSDLLIPVQESSRLRRISKFGWHLLLGFCFGLWLKIPGCLVNHFEAPFFTDSQHGIYHHLKNHPFANLRMWMHHLWQGLKVPNWNQVRWLKNLDVLLEVGIDGYIYGLFHQLINRFLFFIIIHWSHLWS